MKRMYMKIFSEKKDEAYFMSDDVNMPIIRCINNQVELIEKPIISLENFILDLVNG